jgi:hypothetical protein
MGWCRLSIPAADALALEALSRGLPVRIVARGQSMRPAIRDGDGLMLVGDTATVGVGDVVVLPDRPFAVCHRVIARLGERVWVKGDAIGCLDGCYARRALLARVVAVERGRLHQPARAFGAVVRSVTLAGPRWLRATL